MQIEKQQQDEVNHPRHFGIVQLVTENTEKQQPRSFYV